MGNRKTLNDLTLKDNFMFGAVMSDETNCRRLLELILQIPIERVQVSKEKNIIYNPEYKGVRLDVYAEDEKNTRYNVEMQSVQKSALEKRTRYYHSQIDMELLLSGEDYAELPDTYVIFICDFDPFDEGKYQYSFEQKCKENAELSLKDGSKSIFLNTRGKNAEEVPKALVKFLDFVKADLEDSMKNFADDYVESLQKTVQAIKKNRKWEEHFMGWYDVMQDAKALARAEGRMEGRAEGRAEAKAQCLLEVLKEYGSVPEILQDKISKETDDTVLDKWFKTAINAKSIEQFMKEI